MYHLKYWIFKHTNPNAICETWSAEEVHLPLQMQIPCIVVSKEVVLEIISIANSMHSQARKYASMYQSMDGWWSAIIAVMRRCYRI